jgi:hypothetical protein
MEEEIEGLAPKDGLLEGEVEILGVMDGVTEMLGVLEGLAPLDGLLLREGVVGEIEGVAELDTAGVLGEELAPVDGEGVTELEAVTEGLLLGVRETEVEGVLEGVLEGVRDGDREGDGEAEGEGATSKQNWPVISPVSLKPPETKAEPEIQSGETSHSSEGPASCRTQRKVQLIPGSTAVPFTSTTVEDELKVVL